MIASPVNNLASQFDGEGLRLHSQSIEIRYPEMVFEWLLSEEDQTFLCATQMSAIDPKRTSALRKVALTQSGRGRAGSINFLSAAVRGH